ncbi:MAG: hypothetical protein AVDCRST_MAG48-1770, partial [uncultured Friedmanniella sp.]
GFPVVPPPHRSRRRPAGHRALPAGARGRARGDHRTAAGLGRHRRRDRPAVRAHRLAARRGGGGGRLGHRRPGHPRGGPRRGHRVVAGGARGRRAARRPRRHRGALGARGADGRPAVPGRRLRGAVGPSGPEAPGGRGRPGPGRRLRRPAARRRGLARPGGRR